MKINRWIWIQLMLLKLGGMNYFGDLKLALKINFVANTLQVYILAPPFETMKSWFSIMCYEISVPLNTSYWDKPWQAHVVTEVDGTLQEERKEEERNGERKEMGKEREGKGEGSRGGVEEDGKGRERRPRYVCQCVVNGYR